MTHVIKFKMKYPFKILYRFVQAVYIFFIIALLLFVYHLLVLGFFNGGLDGVRNRILSVSLNYEFVNHDYTAKTLLQEAAERDALASWCIHQTQTAYELHIIVILAIYLGLKYSFRLKKYLAQNKLIIPNMSS